MGTQAVGLVQRIGLAVVGGYSLTVLIVVLLAWVLSGLMASSEAVVLSAMLGFPVYLVILLWAFAQHRLRRLWVALGVVPALSFALIWVLA